MIRQQPEWKLRLQQRRHDVASHGGPYHMVGLREGSLQGLSALKLQESFISLNKSVSWLKLLPPCTAAKHGSLLQRRPLSPTVWPRQGPLAQNAAGTGCLSRPSARVDRVCVTPFLKCVNYLRCCLVSPLTSVTTSILLGLLFAQTAA